VLEEPSSTLEGKLDGLKAAVITQKTHNGIEVIVVGEAALINTLEARIQRRDEILKDDDDVTHQAKVGRPDTRQEVPNVLVADLVSARLEATCASLSSSLKIKGILCVEDAPGFLMNLLAASQKM